MKHFSLFLSIICIVVCFGCSHKPEPKYKGKPLSDWVNECKDKDPKTRVDAAEALGEIGSEAKTAIPALTELLKDKDSNVRSAAARALGGIGVEAKTAILALTELLNDENTRSQYAAEALGRIGPEAKTAIPALTELLKAENWEAREYAAAEALGRISPEAQMAALLELLKDKDSKVRANAAAALARIGPEAKTAIPALMKLLNDKVIDDPHWQENEWARMHAIRALIEIKGRNNGAKIAVFTELLKAENSDVQIDAIRALGEIGSEAKTAVPVLMELLKDKDPFVRYAAAEALGKIGPEAKTAIPALTELLNNEDSTLRSSAEKALTTIKGKRIGDH